MSSHTPESAIALGVIASLRDLSTVTTAHELAELLGISATEWDSPRECAARCAALVAGWLAIPVDQADLARELFLRLNGGSGEAPSPLRHVAR